MQLAPIIAAGLCLAAVVLPSEAREAAICRTQLVSSAPGENHVLFHGVSPDGRRLAIGWDRKSGTQVERGAFLLNLRTHNRTGLPGLNNAPSFSPNGHFLVSANYSADQSLRTELAELDRRTGRVRTYASGPSAEWLASYSGDGGSILFNSTRSGVSDLYRVRRRDGAIERLTDDPRYEAHGQFFDRDERVLYHRQTAADDYDVMILDIRTGKSAAVGATPAEEAYPAISPDRRWIAFSAVASAGARPNLFIMHSDGSARRRLTSGEAKDAYAAWAPDGRSIYFVRFDPEGSKIYRIGVRNGHCTA